MPKRVRHHRKNPTAKVRHNIILFFNAARRWGNRVQNWMRERAFPLFRKLPKAIWTLIGAIALILGLVFNLSLDLPELVSKYLFTPTPLPFPIANLDNNEVLVIITDFSGTDGITASTRIFRSLVERSQTLNLKRVRIERLNGITPIITEDAQKIGLQFNATLVIWGTADGYGIEPRYEVVENKNAVSSLPSLGLTISSNPPSFSTYVVIGLPNEYEYLMLITLGQLAYYSDDYSQAISLFSNAIATDLGERSTELNLDDALEFRALAYQKVDNSDAALDDLNQAISINSQKASHYFNRAFINLFGGKIEIVLDDYNKTIELDPQYPMAYVNRATINKIMGQGDKALEDYQNAIDLGEFDALFGYQFRGDYYASIGEYEKAEDDYSSAIDLVSQKSFDNYNPYIRAEAWNWRAKFYINRQEYQKAIDDLTKAITIYPHNLSFFNNRAVAYGGLGQHEKAIADLTYAIDHAPDSLNASQAYSNRGGAYAEYGKYEKAISDLNYSIELDNTDPNTYRSLGLVYFRMGLKSEALQPLEKYLELIGDSADPQIIEIVKTLKTENGTP